MRHAGCFAILCDKMVKDPKFLAPAASENFEIYPEENTGRSKPKK